MAKKRMLTTAERIVKALETIAYQNEQLINIKYVLKEQNEMMKLQLEAISFLMLKAGVCDKFGKMFEDKVKNYSQITGWSFYANKKDWNS